MHAHKHTLQKQSLWHQKPPPTNIFKYLLRTTKLEKKCQQKGIRGGKKEITDEPRSQFWRKCEEIRKEHTKAGFSVNQEKWHERCSSFEIIQTLVEFPDCHLLPLRDPIDWPQKPFSTLAPLPPPPESLTIPTGLATWPCLSSWD